MPRRHFFISLGKETVEKTYRIRRRIANLPNDKAMQTLIDALDKHPDNASFLASIPS